MASWAGVEAIYVEDAAGILKPERARTLLPAIREATGSIDLELHCHNTTGLAQHNYIVGLESGYTTLHTASRPLANGVSMPTAAALERAARAGGHAMGRPVEFAPRIYDYQLPGGMTGTLINQLAKNGMSHRLPEVLEAIPQVRVDLGQPVMATPFSQFVDIQAVLNVVTGQPYSIVPD